MPMEQLLSIASGLTPVLQVVLIAVLAIIFWEPIAQRLGWKEEKEEKMPPWANTLVQHFNHETTDAQEKIIEHLEILHEKSDRSNQLLEEILKYGITCRNK